MTIIESHDANGALTVRPLRDNDHGATVVSPEINKYRVYAGLARADVQVPVGGRIEIYREVDNAAF